MFGHRSIPTCALRRQLPRSHSVCLIVLRLALSQHFKHRRATFTIKSRNANDEVGPCQNQTLGKSIFYCPGHPTRNFVIFLILSRNVARLSTGIFVWASKNWLAGLFSWKFGKRNPLPRISELLHVGFCSVLHDIFVPQKTTEINQSPCCFEVMFRQRKF